MVRNISEEELLLRKRARRRLLGAITLVTLLVIFLPMLFDDESKQEHQEIDIQIPSEDLVTENYPWMMPTDPSADENEALTDQPDESLVMAPHGSPQIADEIHEESSNDQGTPIPLSKPQYHKPVAQLSKASEISQPKANEGVFVIQLGAFSDPLKAKQQLQNLTSSGINGAYVETIKVGPNEMVRVRVGPFATRKGAEDEYEKLKRMGLSGVVTSK
ncbi:MAG: SPOR domain-containing protein [Nitrosomonas sp.]|nr:SPOR domain-containing protein [Nitrosomonas sp.]MBK7363663.1 SPOR domain-containing protein [Nitrosomonas sp.]